MANISALFDDESISSCLFFFIRALEKGQTKVIAVSAGWGTSDLSDLSKAPISVRWWNDCCRGSQAQSYQCSFTSLLHFEKSRETA